MVSREPFGPVGTKVVGKLTWSRKLFFCINLCIFFCISFFARTRTGSCYFNMAEKIPGGPRRPSALLKKFKKAAETVKQTQRFTTLKRKSRLSNKFKENVLVQLSVKCIAWHAICRVLTTNSWEKEDLRAGYMKHPVRGMSPSDYPFIQQNNSQCTEASRRLNTLKKVFSVARPNEWMWTET